MRSKLMLRLLSLPSIVGSFFIFALMVPAQAKDTFSETPKVSTANSVALAASCDATPKHTVQTKSSASDPAMLDFTAAESDAAAILFGCDCPSCLNALRQLRTPTLTASTQGHCWSNLSQQSTQQDINSILEAVEQAEEQGPETPLEWVN
jgi:hypothetical protein